MLTAETILLLDKMHADCIVSWRNMEKHGKAWNYMEKHGKAWKSVEEHGKACIPGKHFHEEHADKI